VGRLHYLKRWAAGWNLIGRIPNPGQVDLANRPLKEMESWIERY
jgi:hypothetical protein